MQDKSHVTCDCGKWGWTEVINRLTYLFKILLQSLYLNTH